MAGLIIHDPQPKSADGKGLFLENLVHGLLLKAEAWFPPFMYEESQSRAQGWGRRTDKIIIAVTRGKRPKTKNS